MTLSIRNRLFLGMTGVAMTFFVLSVMAGSVATRRYQNQEMTAAVHESRAAYERLADLKRSLLQQTARGVTQTPFLRATLGIPGVDEETALVALEQIAALHECDLLLLVDGTGRLLADMHRRDWSRRPPGARSGSSDALAGKPSVRLWIVDGVPHWVALEPVIDGGRTLGCLVFGTALSTSLADEIRAATGATAIFVHEGTVTGISGGRIAHADVTSSELEQLTRMTGPTSARIGGHEMLALPVSIGAGTMVVLARGSFEELLAGERALSLSILLGGIASCLVAMLVGWRLSLRLGRPIQELSVAARAFGAGDRRRRVHIRSGDEVAELGDNFNRMADDLTQALEAAEASSEAKSLFLANVSHELRTPITVILGSGEVLQNTALDAMQSQFVQQIGESGRDLLALVEDVLSFSHLDDDTPPQRNDFVLSELLAGVVHERGSRRDAGQVVCSFEVDDSLPAVVVADERAINRIVTHLLDNAVKFTKDGRIDVRASESAPGIMRIAVADTGVGIEASAIPRLFDSFAQLDGTSTREAGGVGLGLTLCKRWVERLGGELGVESTPGTGSTFWFTVPYANGDEVAEAA